MCQVCQVCQVTPFLELNESQATPSAEVFFYPFLCDSDRQVGSRNPQSLDSSRRWRMILRVVQGLQGRQGLPVQVLLNLEPKKSHCRKNQQEIPKQICSDKWFIQLSIQLFSPPCMFPDGHGELMRTVCWSQAASPSSSSSMRTCFMAKMTVWRSKNPRSRISCSNLKTTCLSGQHWTALELTHSNPKNACWHKD